MRIDITTSGEFRNTISWLNDTKNKLPVSSLNDIGRRGVASLKASTPRDTGLTAAGWQYKVARNRSGADVVFYNTAHPSSANIAMLIQYGHGTGTGGYVPPIDFINPAMRPIFNIAGDQIAKEMFK